MIQKAAALYQQKDYEHAELLCQELLKKEPENSQVYHLLGVIKYEEQCYEEAIHYLEKSIELKPTIIDAHIAIAGCHEKQGRFELAIQHYNTAYGLAPSNYSLQLHVCQLLRNSGQIEKAITTLKSFLQKCPDNAEGLMQLIHLFMAVSDFTYASKYLTKLKAISPKSSEVWSLSGLINDRLGKPKEAERSFSYALEISPDDIKTKLNFSSFLQERGDFQAAKKLYTALLSELSRKNTEEGLLSKVHYNLALIELGYGNFSAGWKHLQQRPKKSAHPPNLSAFKNKKIAILGEEGLGDELMFLRFIPLLKRNGNYINYLTSPKLAPLLSTISSIDKVSHSQHELADCDLQISAMDLPAILNINNTDAIPPPIPIKSTATPGYIAEPGKPVIGLSWRAGFLGEGKSNEKSLHKNIPLNVIIKIISKFSGTVVILQRELQQEELLTLKESLKHINFVDASELNDNLTEMLNILSQLDTYIGVSNTNMHLYGSLGKKGCVIIPEPGEWRWMWDGERSPWYPTFKLIRKNHNNEEWGYVIEEATDYLDNIKIGKKLENLGDKTTSPRTVQTTEAYRNLTHALLAEQDLPGIREIIRQLQQLKQDSYGAQFDIITDILQAGFNQEAIDLYLELVEQYGETPLLLCNIGSAYKNLDQSDKAINYFQEALALDKNYIIALNNLANTLIGLGKFSLAETHLLRALDTEPDNINVNINYGHLMSCRQEHHKALYFYQKAEKCEPSKNILLNYNLGNTFHALGELNRAEQYYEKCLIIDPSYADAEFNLGIVNLTQGNLKKGWRHYFKRLRYLSKNEVLSPISPGIPLNGKHIHFSSNQGIGDELFFLRFLSLIKERYKTCHISYIPSSKLYPLLIDVPVIDQLVKTKEHTPIPDYYFKIDDVALLLNINSLEEIPAPLLLPCDNTIRNSLKKILAKYPPPYTGVAWRAGATQPYQALENRQQILSKNFPLEELIKLIENTEGTAVIVQREMRDEELTEFNQKVKKPFINLSHLNDSLPEMLALLDLLDDYIGVSSTNIHLLAARNKGGKIFVPSPPDWKWMASGNSSVWLPGFTIYRQQKNGCWDQAVEQLTQSIT